MNRHFFGFSLLLWSLFYVPQALASESAVQYSHCKDLLSDTTPSVFDLESIFRGVFNRKSVYRSRECHANVIRLFAEFKKEIPSLQPQDFKVLYIATSTWASAMYDEKGFHVTNAREGFRQGELHEFANWHYHVVLEFEGRIFDLDFTDKPQTLDRQSYMEEFFVSAGLIQEYKGRVWGHPDDLLVMVVPGDQYLTHAAQRSHSYEFHKKMLSDYPALPLSVYLAQ
jgi:hypothetical protein